MEEITIYSRNIFGVPFFAKQHKIRIDALAKQVRFAKADILFLQEVFLPKDRREFKKCLGDDFNLYRAKDGFLSLGGGLCGLFKKDLVIENNFKAFDSSGFFNNLTIVDKIAEKGFQIFKIQQPTKITLINTHLTCPYEKDINLDKRMKGLMEDQISKIKDYIDSESIQPIIICGDFNLETTQDIMKDFIAESGLENRSAHLHKTILGNFYSPKWLFQSTVNEKKPDYVLTKNIPKEWQISVKRASDHHTLISDHVGIITTISF